MTDQTGRSVERVRLSRLKRLVFWQIVLLPTYALVGIVLIVAAVLEAGRLGPYTTWYNHHLRKRAESDHLIGAPEARVVELLGCPDNIMTFSAGFVTMYEYYPYPFLPMSKFQVHCIGGTVRVIEEFDD